MKRRDFIITSALAIGGIFLDASPAYGDTVYYGGAVKGKTNPACVVWDEVKAASSVKLPAANNPNYNKDLQRRNDNIYGAINAVATEKGYDVVVEKNDPPIISPKAYVDINDLVKAEIKKIEKQFLN